MTFSPAVLHNSPVTSSQDEAIKRRLSDLEKQLEDVRALVSSQSEQGSDVRLSPDKSERLAQVREVIRVRRTRTRYFDSNLFGEPAWDLLLELSVTSLLQRRVSVSAICQTSGSPPTTALRWLTALEQEGLLQRRPDPLDRRRIFVELTEAGSNAMDAYFNAVGE